MSLRGPACFGHTLSRCFPLQMGLVYRHLSHNSPPPPTFQSIPSSGSAPAAKNAERSHLEMFQQSQEGKLAQEMLPIMDQPLPVSPHPPPFFSSFWVEAFWCYLHKGNDIRVTFLSHYTKGRLSYSFEDCDIPMRALLNCLTTF